MKVRPASPAKQRYRPLLPIGREAQLNAESPNRLLERTFLAELAHANNPDCGRVQATE